MMFDAVDNIIHKHYTAPSNLTVEEVNILARAIHDAEIADDEQQQIIRKYYQALEETYNTLNGAVGPAEVAEILNLIERVLHSD